MPGLFMRPETVRNRLKILTRNSYPVLPLREALQRLNSGTLPSCATVLTYDDGFYGNYKHWSALYEECPLPSTIYVTTYYVIKTTPVFRLAIQYMFLKSTRSELVLDGLPGVTPGLLDLKDVDRKTSCMWELILHAESALNESERVLLGRELGSRLGMSFEQLAMYRGLSLMNFNEIRDLSKRGVDIQLHTHRHRFPPDRECVTQEIKDNRAALEQLVDGPLDHMCYPSGVFSPLQWKWLEQLGVKSATTCEPGLNGSQTPRFALRRFLDAESISEIEFEAELSGFSDVCRRILGRRPRASVSPHSHGR
ncbi:Polysaccharide deacetylase [Lacipirellula limnantheis]|uniref:Polysaccharide deacetylase n=2 Tax=Lacipirellula limnantheis TaxID=2528024 RepID=A0A517TY86_9BACT|nr:Polysaccharide deacetylase [Lacipirellula limnantheis]